MRYTASAFHRQPYDNRHNNDHHNHHDCYRSGRTFFRCFVSRDTANETCIDRPAANRKNRRQLFQRQRQFRLRIVNMLRLRRFRNLKHGIQRPPSTIMMDQIMPRQTTIIQHGLQFRHGHDGSFRRHAITVYPHHFASLSIHCRLLFHTTIVQFIAFSFQLLAFSLYDFQNIFRRQLRERHCRQRLIPESDGCNVVLQRQITSTFPPAQRLNRHFQILLEANRIHDVPTV